MTYFELMQKAGKQIHPKVYYYDDSNNKIEYDYDNIKKIKLSFNSDVVGTCMKGLTAILKIKLPDKAIYFSNTVKYNGTSATKTYGPFYFKSEPKYDADEKTYTHTMYDSFLTTMVDYEPVKITYPTTVLEFFKKLCQSCNLITNISSLPNGNRVMSYDVYSDIGFTYRDVFADIGQATATLFVVDNGEVKKRTLGTTEIVIDDDILRNQNISLGTHFGPINSIILSRSEGTDKIYKRDENLTSWNAFEIKDNQLMNNNNRSDYLDDLYSALYGLEYDIYDLELVGYGGFDPLDKIKVETGGKNYYSYVLNNEIEFTQGVKEIIYTEMPEQTQENYKTSDTTDKRISKAYILLDKQSKTIEQVVTSVNGQNEKISEITQNVDEINSKISDIADITTSGESQQASVSLEKVNESEPIAIKIHPISEDISYLYPSEFLYPSEDLYPMNRVIRFTNTDTNEVFEYELPDDLLFFNSNNYDEFILNYDSQTCSIIKKVEYDKTTGKNKIKSGTETVNYEYPSIALTDGDYIVSLPGYSNAYLYVQLMASNIYTTQFATKVEVKSSIKQTADAINLEVSKKVDESEVISSINLSSEASTIKANKIKFEGLVTANENFKILADGSIEAKNASLSGNVYLPDGGKVVGGDGMMSVMIVNGNLWGQQFAGASGFVPLGFETFVDQNSNFKTVANAMVLEFMIPSNFKSKKAFIYLRHIPTQNSYDSSGNKITGYSKNIKAYINSGNFYRDIDWTTQKFTISGSYSEISNCFGSSGFTGSSSGIKEGTSIDITNLIKNKGTYSIKLQSSYNSDDSYADTGCVLAQLYIYGYTSENIS